MDLFKSCRKRKARLFYPEVALNSPADNEHKDFPRNKISSTKYTIITFLPKNLYEQFRYVFYLRQSALLNSYTGPKSDKTAIILRIGPFLVSRRLCSDLSRLNIGLCGAYLQLLGPTLDSNSPSVGKDQRNPAACVFHSLCLLWSAMCNFSMVIRRLTPILTHFTTHFCLNCLW